MMKDHGSTPPEPRFHGEVTEKSHRNMSRIRGKDTSIEVKLRKALWRKGIRYRKNYKKIPGRPDIAITKYKIAVFCDSEFFHGIRIAHDTAARASKNDTVETITLLKVCI